MLEGSLYLNNVLDGFRDERRLKFFFDNRIVGLKEFSEPTCNPDNKGESAFEQ